MAPNSEARSTLTPVLVPIGRQSLNGDLGIPPEPRGLVVFAHGSGSSRYSPRNQFVARYLRKRGLATLLIDLLTSKEESVDAHTAEFRFDIELLGRRLVAIIDWLGARSEVSALPLGLFGASTGAGAALKAAAARPAAVTAIVSRGGRPDLAGSDLARVSAPTLLIVGGDDQPVIDLNRSAMAEMRAAPVHLEIVPGATHLFEEPGTLEQVAERAGAWFVSAFSAPASHPEYERTVVRH